MEILGIGGWEIVAILLLLLIVAGPKRMIAWSYTLGKYLAILRGMWAETAAMLQKELRQAGLDVEVPKEPPTKSTITRTITTTITKAAAPVTEPLRETQKQLSISDLMGPMTPRSLNKPVNDQPAPPATNGTANGAPPASNGASFGAWGGAPASPARPDSPPPKEDSDFGAWGGG